MCAASYRPVLEYGLVPNEISAARRAPRPARSVRARLRVAVRYGGAVSALLWLLVPSLPVGADDNVTARDWLEKMSRAAHKLNYQGTFVYLHDDRMMSMHITRYVDADGEHERLISLNGTGREWVRDNGTMTCITPDAVAQVAQTCSKKVFPYTLPMRTDKLAKYYNFLLGGRERVAGRAARVITIKPKDAYRYSYRLWIDEANHLLLKADMLNERQLPVEQVMFTSINLGAAPETARAVGHMDRPAAAPAPSTAQETDQAWRIGAAPQGFNMVERKSYFMPRVNTPNPTPVEHLVLSDGLASVSVFIEKLNPEDKFVGASRRGAVNAFGTITHEHQITVVGEVPPSTVQMIALSVSYAGRP